MTSKPDFSRLRVNERLFAAGLEEKYREAAERGDSEALQALLAQVDLRIAADGTFWDLNGNHRVED
ncbi:hypothetical protein [Parasphingopyxis marina]|uniref:Uncharacterized protein n=1 Tax=Parasphingopyxis marina TaxID=2761622 RepID=A0A842HQZ6_9SPHN|nr:hypothetical protein [Parasphingopyxis marina]MBC2776188.1 hypothetical protein [Parasphingopyxis marina]